MVRVYFDYSYAKHITSLMCSKYIWLEICGRSISKLLHKQNFHKVILSNSPRVSLRNSISSCRCPHICSNRHQTNRPVPTALHSVSYFTACLTRVCDFLKFSGFILPAANTRTPHSCGIRLGCSVLPQPLSLATTAGPLPQTHALAMTVGRAGRGGTGREPCSLDSTIPPANKWAKASTMLQMQAGKILRRNQVQHLSLFISGYAPVRGCEDRLKPRTLSSGSGGRSGGTINVPIREQLPGTLIQ